MKKSVISFKPSRVGSFVVQQSINGTSGRVCQMMMNDKEKITERSRKDGSQMYGVSSTVGIGWFGRHF